MVLRFQGEHCKSCSGCNLCINALHLFLDDCLIDSSLLGHGRGRAAPLRELTSHTRLAPAIIKGYLLWWEKRRYDGYLFHRNLNEIIRSWDFGKVWRSRFLPTSKQYQNEKRTLIDLDLLAFGQDICKDALSIRGFVLAQNAKYCATFFNCKIQPHFGS